MSRLDTFEFKRATKVLGTLNNGSLAAIMEDGGTTSNFEADSFHVRLTAKMFPLLSDGGFSS